MRTFIGAVICAALLAGCGASEMEAVDENVITGADWASTPLKQRELEVVFDVDPTLDTHMIARPADLDAIGFQMPVVLWENGACSWENENYRPFLGRLAASGMIVLLKGGAGRFEETPRPAGSPEHLAFIDVQKDIQLDALEWVLAQDNNESSNLHGKVDESRIITMGFSCGALPAVENAAADHRIKSVLFLNSGVRPGVSAEEFDAFLAPIPSGTPIGMIDGGSTDMAGGAGRMSFDNMPGHIPVVLGNWEGAGHGGFWSGAQSAMYQPRLAEYALDWIDYTLVSGSDAAREGIIGENCDLCDLPEFTLEQKHWDVFLPPSGPANELLQR
jgi:endo-1,4-beta-xylanase